MTKVVKVRDILVAIKKNGLEFTRGDFYKDADGDPTTYKKDAVAACSLGMAAINLNVNPLALRRSLDWIGSDIMIINDNTSARSFAEVVERFIESHDSEILDRDVYIQTLKAYKEAEISG